MEVESKSALTNKLLQFFDAYSFIIILQKKCFIGILDLTLKCDIWPTLVHTRGSIKKFKSQVWYSYHSFQFFEKIKQQLIKPLVLCQFFHENCWFFEVCLK
jgi:hypothetical protein